MAMAPASFIYILHHDALLASLVAAVAGTATYVAGQPQPFSMLNELRVALRKIRTGKSFERPLEADAAVAALFDELDEIAERLGQNGQGPYATDINGSTNLLSPEEKQQLQSAIRILENSLSEHESTNSDVQAAVARAQDKLEGLSAHVQTLATSADESSSSILEMSATTDEVAENIGELASSVREMVASIEEMTFSIREVATNVDELSLTAEETSSSMTQMDVSIDQVQSNADETARLSEEVARDAEQGAASILKTMGEIYRIKESSEEALGVISNLGTRIEAIGEILNVIDDVAEQTNLLALNAAIIAAQAGEHGKGFAVVADEIKDLAERAGDSTKEIAELIKTIQAESKNAISAVERGASNVDRGVEVSNEAERALKKILESSQKSTSMVRAIARATVEQAKGSKQVTDAIHRIAETVQQIAAATAEQARGSDLIMKSGEKMRTISQQVERSSQEQARGSRQITQAIEAINGMVAQVSAAQREYKSDSAEALQILKKLESLGQEQRTALGQVTLLAERNH